MTAAMERGWQWLHGETSAQAVAGAEESEAAA